MIILLEVLSSVPVVGVPFAQLLTSGPKLSESGDWALSKTIFEKVSTRVVMALWQFHVSYRNDNRPRPGKGRKRRYPIKIRYSSYQKKIGITHT